MSTNQVFAFPTELGWVAVLGSQSLLRQLTFGYTTPQQALAAMDRGLVADADHADWFPDLVRSIQSYAAGGVVDFSDVQVDAGPQTAFQRRVVDRCRKIRFGQTMTYGQLARAAGSPAAARAVGNVMATNRTPLVVPCHRVVASSGSLGGYSAAGGTRTKLRMLEMEAARDAASFTPTKARSRLRPTPALAGN